jgi:CPA1 family monovalent cation:H+ antiporter
LHGLTLPTVIRRLDVRGHEDFADALAEAQAQTAAAQAAAARLAELDDGNPLTRHAVAKLRYMAESRSNAAWERLGPVEEVDRTPSVAFRRLRMQMLAAEREVFVRYRDERRIDDEVFRRVQRELDLEDSMLRRDT